MAEKTERRNQVTLQLCPRCEREWFLPYEQADGMGGYVNDGKLPHLPALSRATRNRHDVPIYVCSRCGSEEGMLQFQSGVVIAPEKWPVERTLLPWEEES